VVEIDKFAAFPLLYLRTFEKKRSSLLYITTTTGSGFLPTQGWPWITLSACFNLNCYFPDLWLC